MLCAGLEPQGNVVLQPARFTVEGTAVEVTSVEVMAVEVTSVGVTAVEVTSVEVTPLEVAAVESLWQSYCGTGSVRAVVWW